jgi:hypothetical protein
VLLQLVAQVGVVAHQLHLLPRAPDENAQLRGRERLGDVVVGAGADGLDAAVDRGEAGDHHHQRFRRLLLDFLQQGQPVHVWQVQVGEDDVGVVPAKAVERRLAAALGVHLVPFAAQDLAAALDQQLLVVDDEHADRDLGGRRVAHWEWLKKSGRQMPRVQRSRNWPMILKCMLRRLVGQRCRTQGSRVYSHNAP